MLSNRIDAVIQSFGRVICWANALLLGVITAQVALRYGFNKGLVVLEELQWHIYAVTMMFALAYNLSIDLDVRVDIFYRRWSPRNRARWDMFGIIVFVIPFVIVVLINSFEFVYDSWRVNEHSSAPTGLPWRWLIKSVIPISFGLLFAAAFARLLHNIVIVISSPQ